MKYLKPRENTISYFFYKVSEFNFVAGNRLDNEEDVKQRLIPLYHNLLVEEMQEIMDAKDAVDELDGLCDTAVVAYFLCKLYGVEINGFVPNGIMTDNVLEQIQNIIDSEDNEDKAVRALLMSLDTLSALDVDMHGALHNVADSNLSKFIKIGDNVPEDFQLDSLMLSALEQVIVDIQADGRYKGVVWKRVGDYIVFTDENGKVLKASTYKEPSLKQFINKRKRSK